MIPARYHGTDAFSLGDVLDLALAELYTPEFLDFIERAGEVYVPTPISAVLDHDGSLVGAKLLDGGRWGLSIKRARSCGLEN